LFGQFEFTSLQKKTSRSLEVNLNLVLLYPMMIIFTHGKKILVVKGSKPNFTSRDDALFPNPANHYFPQKPLVYT